MAPGSGRALRRAGLKVQPVGARRALTGERASLAILTNRTKSRRRSRSRRHSAKSEPALAHGAKKRRRREPDRHTSRAQPCGSTRVAEERVRRCDLAYVLVYRRFNSKNYEYGDYVGICDQTTVYAPPETDISQACDTSAYAQPLSAWYVGGHSSEGHGCSGRERRGRLRTGTPTPIYRTIDFADGRGPRSGTPWVEWNFTGTVGGAEGDCARPLGVGARPGQHQPTLRLEAVHGHAPVDGSRRCRLLGRLA